MLWNMRISEHIYNSSDSKRDHGDTHFKAETKAINRAASQSRFRYASGVSRQEIQKMWKAQLPLCRRTRPRELLPFCQCARSKSHHDLRLSQKPRQGQKSFGKLSSCPKNSGRCQHNQSRSVRSKGNIVGARLWTSLWKPPPSSMAPLFVSPICCKLIW